MICPFCGKEMKRGIMSGDGRSRIFWKAGDQKASLADRITGVGKVTAAKHRIGVFTMVTYYSKTCGIKESIQLMRDAIVTREAPDLEGWEDIMSSVDSKK